MSLYPYTGITLGSDTMISLGFLLTSLVVVLIPGTGVLFTISTGLSQGRRAANFAALGCTLGILPHLLATVAGLAAVMHTSAVAFQALRYAGTAYLLYIALSTWRDRSAFALQGEVPAQKNSKLVLKAFLLNILNPKLTLFFLAFLPQFVHPGPLSAMAQLLSLSAIFMLMTLVVFVLYGYLAHAFRVVVIGSPRVQNWMRRSFAATFAILGIELATAER